jgi:EF hand
MKNISKLIIAALTLGSSAWITAAQPADAPPPDGDRPPPRESGPPGDPAMRGRRPPLPLMKALDANGDGVIDADEIANASAALKKLDKNGDGTLTLDELLPPRPAGPPPGDGQAAPRPQGTPPAAGSGGGTNHPPVLPIVAALDANGDGVIDADEIANAPAALKKLDKNGDGKLTSGEFLPLRPVGPARRGGGRGPGGAGGPPPGDDQPPPPRPPPGEE